MHVCFSIAAALSDHATSSVALVDPASDFDIATGRAGECMHAYNHSNMQ